MTATQSLTLSDRETYLATLQDAVESIEPEHEPEFLEEFSRALKSAIEKRDACGWYLATQDSRVDLIDGEIARLQALKAQTCKRIERVERGVTLTIESLGFDSQGKYRKLEGHTSSFSLAGCPPSVEITDLEKVPREFKKVSLTMPAELWDAITDLFTPEIIASVQQHVTSAQESPDKRAIKAEMDRGYDIEGADLAIGKYRLVRS